MRNLKTIHRRVIPTPKGQGLSACAWDVGTETVVCATGPATDDPVVQLYRCNPAKSGEDSQNIWESIAAWDAPCALLDLDCDKIVDLHYFSDGMTTCVVFAGGDIVIVRESFNDGEEKIEIVGSVDVGISAATWSPDEDLLAILTGASTFLFMTREFDDVASFTFTSEDLKASDHVSVGWGKKDTQFKGRKARALRDPTVPETVDEGVLSGCDDKDTTISWRGDGAFVAVNAIDSGTRRVIRVLSREGELVSVSEPVNGLTGALSWRPSGNLLAGIQRFEDHVDVVFFEKNGLRHGQFPLRLTKEDMNTWGAEIGLSWSADSSVLAVCFNDRTQLWTMGNYHYYLKQEIRLSPAEPSSGLVRWHTENTLRVIQPCQCSFQLLEYDLIVSRGSTSPPFDYGTIAIIDGRCLGLTSLRVANIPPPMTLQKINLKDNAFDVAINEGTASPVVAVLHYDEIHVFDWGFRDSPVLRCVITFSQSSISLDSIPVQIAFNGAAQLAILRSDDTICLVDTTGSNDKILELSAIDSPAAAHSVDWSLRFNSSRCRTFVPEGDGFRSAAIIESSGVQDQVHFKLSRNGSLLANQRLIARNCTSFVATPQYLIFTTSQHLLKFIHMGRIEELETPPDTPESDERCRSIERGARIVTVIPSSFALVLQMPRGNLETIYPRALVLAGIRIMIERREFRDAFLACRNHRVDLNILHDYAPTEFMANVNRFIGQVKKIGHIDLFLSQLREEDVSRTMYQETLKKKTSQERTYREDASGSGAPLDGIAHAKVNAICDAFLDDLKQKGASHLQNVITAHVCKSPPDLDGGLGEITRLRAQGSEKVDRLVEHICFLAEVNKLYDHALGLYDLELALLIAQQSQKDPREYLPFLQSLREMPRLRRQYSIDNHLGRYERALENLCGLDVFEEVKSFTIKHTLYLPALKLYRYQPNELAELVRLHAEHLHQSRMYKEAGIAYESLGDHMHATESYRLAHLWKESLACACLVPLTLEKLQSLARTLADTLVESKDYHSAAIIHMEYLGESPAAARLFCRGFFFADALRVITLHRQSDLLEAVIDVGLADGLASMTELLSECKSQLNAQVPRISELRTRNSENPLGYIDGDVNGGIDIPDNISLAPTDASTTGGSLFTRYTNISQTVGTNATRRSSKNKRREERKKARGKKGTVYEEEYLVRSIARLIERVNAVNEEVENLVVGLMRRGMRERARAVETIMKDVVDLCRDAIEKVFEPTNGPMVQKLRQDDDPSTELRDAEETSSENLVKQGFGESPRLKDFPRQVLLG